MLRLLDQVRASSKEEVTPMKFIIRWATCGYVTKRSPNRKPYASSKTDPDVKTWLTRRAAERFLSLKDSDWANSCVIEEVSP
jgi:Tfp pilus assembly protein PilP